MVWWRVGNGSDVEFEIKDCMLTKVKSRSGWGTTYTFPPAVIRALGHRVDRDRLVCMTGFDRFNGDLKSRKHLCNLFQDDTMKLVLIKPSRHSLQLFPSRTFHSPPHHRRDPIGRIGKLKFVQRKIFR